MDKLTMAHEYALKLMGRGSITIDEAVRLSFDLADAMQAEADKRVNKERPDALCEVDWSLAPKVAIGWVMMSDHSYWHGDNAYLIGNAPSFGFTGSHIMERPHGF